MGSASKGVCFWGGGLHPGGGSASRGVGQTPLRYMEYYGILSTSRWYTSYWNAFLFGHMSNKDEDELNRV